MAWVEISVGVNREQAAIAELALEQAGALAITLQDDADNPVLEPDPGSTPLWPTIHLRGLFEADIDRDTVIRALSVVPSAIRPQNLRWREVGDQDWERAWMDRFEPMQFGRNLWIVPSGMSIPANPDNVEIQLDPGLAFGTGTHPTTALCLEWLDGFDCDGLSAVDYGCGSGILAIAAALKGADRVDCVDTDPQALEATRDNAGRNGVSEQIHTYLPAGFTSQPAGLVLANILAGPLIELAPVIAGCARPNAPIVLSGILAGQAEVVAEAYTPWASNITLTQREEWIRLDMTRK